jgi:TetR/AcrR family acrAB operon transcriptional repressor
MARKTKAEAQLTRDAILDAAEETFRERGVSRTRLEDIAQRAGCTRGAVYWHFKNKADVLIAMFDRVTLPLFDSIQQLVDAAPSDPFGTWRAHLTQSMRKIEQDRQQQSVCDILANRCELTEELQPLSDMELQRKQFFIGTTERLLEQAKTAGQIAPDANVQVVARSVHATIHGLIHMWLRQPSQFRLHEAVDQFIGVLERGIGNR